LKNGRSYFESKEQEEWVYMAKLMRCPTCSHQIAKSAKTCPNCGAKNKQSLGCFALMIFVVGLLIVWGIPSCANNSSSTSTSSQSDAIEETIVFANPVLTDRNNFNGALKDTVMMIDEVMVVNTDTYVANVVGIEFDKSTGDVLRDVARIGLGLNDQGAFADGMSKGFDFGIHNSNARVANMDVYLTLYLSFSFADPEISQRDSIIPKLRISARDDKGDSLKLIHYSHENQHVNLDFPFGLIILKGYYDAEQINVTINGKQFSIEVSKFRA
jgi:predicted nucleic acid-binding Zn ribbon protein